MNLTLKSALLKFLTDYMNNSKKFNQSEKLVYLDKSLCK